MGVTIHYEGTLRDEEALVSFDGIVRAFAAERDWDLHPIDLVGARDVKEVDGEVVERTTDLTGLLVLPHPDCEPLYLVFDGDLQMQDFVKTQFAGPGIHIQIVELLRAIAPLFSELTVQDEGEFWDTGDAGRLRMHMEVIEKRLQERARQSPGSVICVKENDGRIVDIYRARTPEAAEELRKALEPPPRRRSLWKRLFDR